MRGPHLFALPALLMVPTRLINEEKSSPQSSRENKKALVLNAGKKRPTAAIVAVAVAAIALAAAVILPQLAADRSLAPPAADSASATPAVADGRIAYAVSLFDDGKARHFQYADAESNITIAYFILKSTDGVIRAAFDACDVCWRAGKGYYQEGSTMVCRNCGRRFESVLVNEVQGGCNPAPLNRTIEGDRVVIHVEDLKKGRGYFNFS